MKRCTYCTADSVGLHRTYKHKDKMLPTCKWCGKNIESLLAEDRLKLNKKPGEIN